MFSFFFNELYNDYLIQKAFYEVCIQKMLLDGYFDMSTYIYARIKKEEILSKLRQEESIFSFLYEDSYKNENNAYEFWISNTNNINIKEKIYLSNLESIAIVNWVYRIFSNSDKRIEFTIKLFNNTKKLYKITNNIRFVSGVFYNSQKIDLHFIKSISGLNKFISNIKLKNDQKLFFRGHSCANFFLSPSIMRKETWKTNENKMYNQVLIECPEAFSNLNTHLEKLVEMQHYGIPTRLLDITRNPLVSLYFACENNFDSYGEIVLLSVEESKIKYPQSDTVTILSSLPLSNSDEKMKIKNAAVYSTDDPDFNEKVPRLLHEIKLEKPAFLPQIKRNEIIDCFFVYATKNNNRIIKQDGAFIICGLIDDKCTINKYRLKEKGKNVILLVDNKKSISCSLDKLSINKASLFPEIENVSEYIKRQYK